MFHSLTTAPALLDEGEGREADSASTALDTSAVCPCHSFINVCEPQGRSLASGGMKNPSL